MGRVKKTTSQFDDLTEVFDYQSKLTAQHPRDVYKVLYNKNGTHLSSCVMSTHGSPPEVYGYSTQGFIADNKTYYYETADGDEAHYLCALLNAPCVDEAIKIYQTRGIYKGERDITRTPFEACAITPFDAADPDHRELARLQPRGARGHCRSPARGRGRSGAAVARAAVAGADRSDRRHRAAHFGWHLAWAVKTQPGGMARSWSPS